MEQPPAPEIPDQEILENWKITMHRKNPLILHYSCPSNREAEKLQILVKGQDGAWTVRENTVNARYLVFTLEPEESEFCAAILPDHTKLLYSSAALLAIVGIAALWIAGKHIRKRRKTPVKQAG